MTVTRRHLSDAVCREVGLSQNDSAQLVDSVLEMIARSLVAGEEVKISSFGSFRARQKNARIGRNPKTGQEVLITARRAVVFRPSHLLRIMIDRALATAG